MATTAREVRSLARAIREGRLTVSGVADRLAAWVVDEAEDEEVSGEDDDDAE